MDSFELLTQIQTLKQRVSEYMIEEAMKEAQKIQDADEIAVRNELGISQDIVPQQV